jgi:hypothetical protein
LGNYVAI